MKNIMKYLLKYEIKEIYLYLKHKLNRPLIFWPVRYGIDWIVIILSKFYKGKLNISWNTYVLKTEGNFNSKGKPAEENNLIICIIKYCKISTVKKILTKKDLEIKYIDTNLTPLHFAYINKNKKMIDILKKYGANENIKTLKGLKPKDL
tara:strand:+ start:239 stop:685 length:447 start_codon:yes stop_codon:yes gene_type:complete